MNDNEKLTHAFYTSFAALDYKILQSCYNNDPIFNDPVFGILQGNEVKGMWKMLCLNAKNFSLEFSNVNADEEYGTCNWTAHYSFSKTGRKVVNNVKAHMRFANGKITEHTDDFDIYKWSRQALGLPGILLGWSGYLKNKIRSDARNKLISFMNTNSLE